MLVKIIIAQMLQIESIASIFIGDYAAPGVCRLRARFCLIPERRSTLAEKNREQERTRDGDFESERGRENERKGEGCGVG